MDEAGRHALKALKSTIKEKLYLADKIMDLLEEKNTIDEEISQKIKAERTNEERIDKLLYYLKRRGPNAFGNFMEAVKTDPVNKTLVQELETEYQKALTTNDNQGVKSLNGNKEETPRNLNPNNLSSLPQTPASDCLGSKPGEVRGQPYLHHDLSTLYTRLKGHMTSLNLRELSFTSPKPISLQMIAELVDHYLGVVEECYETLGIKERTKPLKSHIVDLKASIKQLKGEIKEHEKKKNKLSHHYIKLENKHRETNRELENKHKETKKTMEDTKAINHELNQKILELETALNNTRSALKEMMEENSHLKQLLHVQEGQSVRMQDNPSSRRETNFADSIANSPSRLPKNAEKRAKRRSSLGVSSQPRRKTTTAYVSPRRSLNQTTANEQDMANDRQRVQMPFVWFHGNTNDGAIANGGSSQITHFVISNTAKVPQVNADCTLDISETPKETRKSSWSRFKNGKK